MDKLNCGEQIAELGRRLNILEVAREGEEDEVEQLSERVLRLEKAEEQRAAAKPDRFDQLMWIMQDARQRGTKVFISIETE